MPRRNAKTVTPEEVTLAVEATVLLLAYLSRWTARRLSPLILNLVSDEFARRLDAASDRFAARAMVRARHERQIAAEFRQ